MMVMASSTILWSCTKSIEQQEEISPFADIAIASKQDQSQKFNTFYSPQVKLGNGKVRSFITISHTGVPSEVGVEMSDAALAGLPDAGVSLVIPFHHKANGVVPFTHVYMNWNPNGHPPNPGPYLVPHFDFHFYMISNAERMTISPADAKMDAIPPPPLWPDGYIPTPSGEPQMGKHWLSPSTSPEICCGQPFTHTFIYGSYDGKFIFMEPMITRAFLMGGATINKPYAPVKQFIVPGTYYPATYNIYTDKGDHMVSLSNFTYH